MVKVCVAYEIDGRRFDHLPADQRMIDRAVPVYEELPGWQEDIRDVRTYDGLPPNARRYLGFLGEVSGIGLGYVGVGPDRSHVVHVPAA